MTAIEERTLPRWNDLPDFGLYMDQVLSLMERYVQTPAGSGEKGLTASMVNNYVKIGAVPSPVKKKYGRLHLACLVIVCVLKTVLPLAIIKDILSSKFEEGDPSELYDQFCEQFERAELEARQAVMQTSAATPDPHMVVVASALSAQAQRNAALTYWAG